MNFTPSKLLDVDSLEYELAEEKVEYNKKLKNVLSVIAILQNEKHEAYIIGGCVRDLLLKKIPKDWDVTTSATPDEIEKLFDHTYTQNSKYGTVGVVCDDYDGESNNFVIEITTYRKEACYTDQRRPDKVEFCNTLEEDLNRRDFTINAIAFDPINQELIDVVGGLNDLDKKIIKTVGEPDDRFNEDLLRIVRAIRIATELNFDIDDNTFTSIEKYVSEVKKIAQERITTEFSKMIMSDNPMRGIKLLHTSGLLKHMIPELEKGIGCDQNQAHSYDVFEHNLRTLQHSADKKWPLHLRLSALFHDVAKPHTREFSKEKNDWTFYSHEVVGAHLSKDIMRKLRYSNELTDSVFVLVRWHMFFF